MRESNRTTKKYSTYALKWAKRIRAINMLGGQCEQCGTDNIFHLSFHHKNEDDKEFKMSQNFEKKWDDIVKEVNKCILLCMNCHQEHHYKHTDAKELLLQYIDKHACQRCGYGNKDNYSSLDFHHRDPSTKEFRIGRSYNQKMFVKPLDDILAEISKCEVICRNCHKIEHCHTKKFDECKEYIYQKVESHRQQPVSDKERILELYHSGMRRCDIASELGCCRSTVSRIVKLYA